jgi:LacI family transcriptional regulator
MSTARAARVTIVDVANAAGVMPSTVSKALNGGRGSPEVRRRVEEAAARLGYRPNQRARGLRRSESRSIGVLIPDLANAMFLQWLRGVEQAAQERAYVVLIADGQRSDDAETAALERFFDQGVDGLLLGGPVTTDALRLYVDHGVPTAPVVDASGRDALRVWEQGETAATREMARRLLELGHRSFAFVSTPAPKGRQGASYRRGRFGALATLLSKARAELTGAIVDPSGGYDGCREDLIRAIQTGDATAIVCATHLLAPWTLMALDETGLRVPDDVSLVVHGDSDWARAYHPPLSVIRRDHEAEGYELACSLLDAIAGTADTHAPAATPAEYIERGSCAPPPSGGRSRTAKSHRRAH